MLDGLVEKLPLNKKMERLPETYAPYIGHLTDHAVLMTDGSRLAMVRLHGSPFELVSPEVRINRAHALNDLLKGFPADHIAFHLVKHEVTEVNNPPLCESAYGRNMMRRYNRVVLGNDLREISWFVSIIVRPTGSKRLSSRGQSDQDADERLNHAVRALMGTLSEHGPKRLGRRYIPTDIPGETIPISEIGSALFLIRTGLQADIPETGGPLGSAVLSVSPEFGKRAFDLRIPGTPRFGRMVSLIDYPSKTRPGMLNDLLDADYSFSITNSFSYEYSRLNELNLTLRSVHMDNSGSRAETLKKGLDKLADDSSSNAATTGMHNFSMAVFSPKLETLDLNVGAATTSIKRFGGANPGPERNVWYNGAMEAQYWALLPGVTWTYCRSGQITTLNLAHLCSLDGYPIGQKRGYWGRSPLRLRTRAGTALDYIPTVDDVAHTAILGFSGAGKTVVISFLKTALEPTLGKDGIRILIDKDESNRISIEMEGGSYVTILRNQASGTAPLKFLDDTPRNRAFLHGLYTWLIMRDGQGPLTPDAEDRLMRGIKRQMKMPKELRSMGGVREFLGYNDPVKGAGARFQKWCAGGSMGWLLDGPSHLINLDPLKARLYGFDFTELIPKEGEVDDGSCQAVAAVIMHQLKDYIDGRRIMCVFEECRFYLDPLQKMIDDYTLTGRKNELMVVLVAQQPEHLINTPIGLSLMSQCRTKILFPNKSADRDSYVNRMNVSPEAFVQLSHSMFVGAASRVVDANEDENASKAARRFLLWRGQDESAICEFDLSGMKEEVAIMSGKARTNKLFDRLKADGHLDLSDMRREFLSRNTKQLAIQDAE